MTSFQGRGEYGDAVLVRAFDAKTIPPAGAALIFVREGEPRLRVHTRSLPEPWQGERMYLEFALALDGTPLVVWQGSECPTCPHLLKAAGLSDAEIVAGDLAINQWTIKAMAAASPEEWAEAYIPILSLLGRGSYWLTVVPHFPTYGNGRFFWSSQTCDSASHVLDERPFGRAEPGFLLPTQQTSTYMVSSWKRAKKSFRTHPGIAYYLDGGYASALLDGHHRATAAAVCGVAFPCVTMMRAKVDRSRRVVYPPTQAFEPFNPIEAPLDLFVTPSCSEMIVPPAHAGFKNWFQSVGGRIPPANAAEKGASSLPTVDHWIAGLRLQVGFGGRLTEEQWGQLYRLRPLPLHSDRYETWFDLGDALTALRVLGDPSWAERCREAARHPIGPDYAAVFENLARLGGPEVDDYFIRFIVEDDGHRPALRRIADDYFERRA
jgi:hypothetical protein